jgi:Xaa-Pro aminopeptidase
VGSLLTLASKVQSLPVLKRLSSPGNRHFSAEEAENYLKSQKLAQRGARHIASLIQEGWSEKTAASLLDQWLMDHGVRSFFHKSFCWFGERTRFVGVKTYYDYLPTERRLQGNEPIILDVAPILNGYTSDIGYSTCLGSNAELAKAKEFLRELRGAIPDMASQAASGAKLWQAVDQIITERGYANVHSQYPFSVLGHRVHEVLNGKQLSFIHFGWQSYWSFLSRGLFGQLLNHNFAGSMEGLWAVEPHIGTPTFGAKFEEILVVEDGKARWLGKEPAEEPNDET